MNKAFFAAQCAVALHSAHAIGFASDARVFSGLEGARVVLAPSADGKKTSIQTVA